MNFKKIYYVAKNQDDVKEVQCADVLGLAISKEGDQYLVIGSEREDTIFEAVIWDEHIFDSKEDAEKHLEDITFEQ